jgi:hypothetical protein
VSRTITYKLSGSTKRTQEFLRKMQEQNLFTNLDALAQRGVTALASATPKRTGVTAASWSYEIERTRAKTSIYWKNSNFNEGVPIVILLQYGHGTGTGGYVQGRDFINEAIKSIFDEIAEETWKVVQQA